MAVTTDPRDLADWQRMTHDPQDTGAVDRCEMRSPASIASPDMGICLRRRDHPRDWHEGRSANGSLVSWSADGTVTRRVH